MNYADKGFRLKQLRKTLNLTQEQMAGSLEMTQSSYAHVERGKAMLTTDKLSIMVINHNLNPMWWITGEGQMFNSTQSTELRNGSHSDFWQDDSIPPNVRLVDSIAQAGVGYEPAEGINKALLTYIPGLPPRRDHYIMLRVSGTSMEPDFGDGDHVICYAIDGRHEMLADAVYVVTTPDGIYIKEVRYINDVDNPKSGYFRLTSRNPKYKDVFIHPVDDQPKLYRVVCVLTAI